MAKKTKNEKPAREMTRRQLSHFQQQKRRQRIILYTGMGIIAAIVVLVLVGWFEGVYRPQHATVIQVNNTKFSIGYYIDTLRLGSQGQTDEYIQQQLPDEAITEIQRNELVRQNAAKIGISVTDAEAREQLKKASLPASAASIDIMRAQMLTSKLLAEYFDKAVPQTAPQVHMTAMLLESKALATQVRERLVNSENFSMIAEELSQDYYTRANGGDLGWHPQSILDDLLGTSVPADYAFGSDVGTLSQPRYDENISKGVGYWLIKVVAKVEDGDAHIQAMLLGSEEEALSVSSRIKAGEDFAALAAELSQDQNSKDSSGELGVISKSKMSTAFDSFAFNPATEVGVLSPPVRDETVITKGGYWLIQSAGKEDDRQIETGDRDYLKSRSFDQWLAILDTSNTFSNLSEAQKAYAISRVFKG